MMNIEKLPFREEDCWKQISCKSSKEGKALLSTYLRNKQLGQIFLKEDALFFQWEKQSIPFYCDEFLELQQRMIQGYAVFALISQNQEQWHCDMFFFQEEVPIGTWEIQLPPKEKDAISKKMQQTSATLQDSSNHMQMKLSQNITAFAFSLGYYPTKQEEKAGYERSSRPTFRLYSDKYCLLLRVIEDEQCLKVVRVEDPKEQLSSSLSLAVGRFRCSPEKNIAPDSAFHLLKDSEGAEYIKLWDNYAQAEGEMLLTKIRVVGEIQFAQSPERRVTERGTFEYVGQLKDPLQGERFRQVKETQGTLLLSTHAPLHLDSSMGWTEYSQRRSEQEEIVIVQDEKESRPSLKKQVVEQHCQFTLNHWNHTLVMYHDKKTPLHFGFYPEEKTAEEEKIEESEKDSKDAPLPKVYVTLDLGGDATRIKRRNQARNRMLDGESANPRMSKVMEGKQLSKAPSQEVLDPLTLDEVMAKAFPYGATKSQRDAVNMAMNTPDIALIQGPPGTGKTTVITAVIEGINQEMRQEQRKAGEILITSYQHDAVDHVQNKIRINSLPPVKFQGKESSDSPSAVDIWCQQWMERFISTHDVLESSLQLEKLQGKYQQYENNPSKEECRQFLEFALTFSKEPSNQKKVKELLEEQLEEKDHLFLLSRVRKLRTTKSGFLDDGKERAEDVIYALCGDYSHEKWGKRREQAKKNFPILFKMLTVTESQLNQEFFQACISQKQGLLEACFAKPESHQVDSHVKEIFHLLEREWMQFDQETGHSKETLIFKDLLKEIKGYSRKSLRNMMSKYALVYGATLQHSVANPIAQAKLGKSFQQQPLHPLRNNRRITARTSSFSRSPIQRAISFDTVIVDEAARANPMDLMIAITQGRRRLILVGDHRQLPQVYDEELLERLQEDSGISLNIEQSKESMFQYLMAMGKKLEALDGIPRTITLKEQFRMHPLLGNFINQQFYASHDVCEAFTSPLSQEDFSQGLETVPLLWLDVPLLEGRSSGGQVRQYNSLKRDLEAKCIVNQLCQYLQQEEDLGESYSYGVISFYSGQKQEIQSCLDAKQGELPHLAEKLEKVQVGTVDSFQGKEFDVMFLSLVRSKAPSLPAQKEPLDDAQLEKLGKKTYGFMTMENRLCVSLSRQKRLLVVVGNSKLYGSDPQWDTLASSAVPSLHGLYQLCQKEGSVRLYGNQSTST